jgi:hypothetical protein
MGPHLADLDSDANTEPKTFTLVTLLGCKSHWELFGFQVDRTEREIGSPSDAIQCRYIEIETGQVRRSGLQPISPVHRRAVSGRVVGIEYAILGIDQSEGVGSLTGESSLTTTA